MCTSCTLPAEKAAFEDCRTLLEMSDVKSLASRQREVQLTRRSRRLSKVHVLRRGRELLELRRHVHWRLLLSSRRGTSARHSWLHGEVTHGNKSWVEPRLLLLLMLLLLRCELRLVDAVALRHRRWRVVKRHLRWLLIVISEAHHGRRGRRGRVHGTVGFARECPGGDWREEMSTRTRPSSTQPTHR